MSNIEVPYLPISNFDASAVVKYFPEALPDDDNNSNKFLMPSLKTADGDGISEKISLILTGMGMEKYIELFEKEHILFDTFLHLSDSDLLEIGITDPKDREIMAKNLTVHQNTKYDCIIPENQSEDYRILMNISRQILLLQNYCTYLELQMKKHKLTDYRISMEESACTYLKAFTETALVQSEIMCDRIYGQQNSLLDRFLKTNNTILPELLQKFLQKRGKGKEKKFKLVTVIGFVSAVVLVGSYCMGKWKAT